MALAQELLEDLLQEVKANCRITWNDEDADLKKDIERSIAYLNSRTGRELDYSVQGSARELVIERCRYSWNKALHDFENNYLSELLSLQYEAARTSYREKGSLN
ncbi:hypothetical protein CF394_11275 [Tetzosporium hominis]|uniref:Phage gp6-like head-tail connector protein n=1 Tax=Tetzosporium hominis TaxID=2020506 RepID=A0A264W1M4_9BACL|nr:phage head-tail connector protein [Tetzosporium hominis]OZS77455.1 hypothetical protein CF394_11275 [Tetzosporium hominis]